MAKYYAISYHFYGCLFLLKFSNEKRGTFLIFAQSIDYGYSLELPHFYRVPMIYIYVLSKTKEKQYVPPVLLYKSELYGGLNYMGVPA